MKFVKVVKAIGFNFYVALSMITCATIFAGFSKPRETISGFVGRQALMGSYFFLYLARAIDWLFGEPGHCGEAVIAEYTMRAELYPEDVVGTLPAELESDDARNMQEGLDRGMQQRRALEVESREYHEKLAEQYKSEFGNRE